MAKKRLLFALLLFLLGAIIIAMNPAITGAVISVQNGDSLLIIGVGFLFILTGLIVAVSAKFDASTNDYQTDHFDSVSEDDSELDKNSFWNEYNARTNTTQTKRRRDQ